MKIRRSDEAASLNSITSINSANRASEITSQSVSRVSEITEVSQSVSQPTMSAAEPLESFPVLLPEDYTHCR